MEAVSYICDNTFYTIKAITTCDSIPYDVNTVYSIIKDTDITQYISNMELSVKQGYSFAIFKDGIRVGFVYSFKQNHQYIGASIYIIGDVVAASIALKTIFDITDSHKIVFMPHKDNLKFFISMIEGTSIRAHYTDNSPIAILRNVVYTKGTKIFKYLNIQEVT